MTEDVVSNVDMEGHTLLAAIKSYHEEIKVYPEGNNARIAKQLQGDNPKKILFIDWPKGEINPAGELLDPWKTPYLIKIGADGDVRIRSAGEDKVFGTKDDMVFQKNIAGRD